MDDRMSRRDRDSLVAGSIQGMSALARRIHGYFTDPEIGGFLPRGFARAYGLTLALMFVAFIVLAVLDR